MAETRIFKSYRDFSFRKDKRINGVSRRFYIRNKEELGDLRRDAGNEGCWDCIDCRGCYYCTRCDDCEGCIGCDLCGGCYRCVDCDSCIDIIDSTRCRHCINLSFCNSCYDVVGGIGLDDDKHQTNKIGEGKEGIIGAMRDVLKKDRLWQ